MQNGTSNSYSAEQWTFLAQDAQKFYKKKKKKFPSQKLIRDSVSLDRVKVRMCEREGERREEEREREILKASQTFVVFGWLKWSFENEPMRKLRLFFWVAVSAKIFHLRRKFAENQISWDLSLDWRNPLSTNCTEILIIKNHEKNHCLKTRNRRLTSDLGYFLLKHW